MHDHTCASQMYYVCLYFFSHVHEQQWGTSWLDHCFKLLGSILSHRW